MEHWATSSDHSRQLFEGGSLPPQKKITIPPPRTAAKSAALNLFFGRNSELQIYHGNFLMDNKHMKLFVIKQSKWRVERVDRKGSEGSTYKGTEGKGGR